MPDVLSDRALGRATLARQLLLDRTDRDVVDVVEHLVGMQAQEPHDPYVGLWARLRRFVPELLADRLDDRSVVRIVAMRGTIHVLSRRDCLGIRPLVQAPLDEELARHSQHRDALAGVDLVPVAAAVRDRMAEGPMTNPELRAFLAERFPAHDPAALALGCRNTMALVQVPPRGLWARSAGVRTTTAESYLGAPLDPAPAAAVVRRYLAAFGPASAADVVTWSRVPALREVARGLRPELRTFRDERGRELLDLPDAALPHPDAPAPVRFLPRYDNVLLSHADRRRVADDDVRRLLLDPDRRFHGSVLVDGRLRGTWRLDALTGRSGPITGGGVRPDTPATLHVDHLGRLARRHVDRVEAEGRRLLRFLAPAASVADVRIAPLT